MKDMLGDELGFQESTGGYDALDTVVFPDADIVTATYRVEGDYIMYGYGGSYFVKVPKNAKVLIRTTNDRPIEGFMNEEFIEKYKGQIQAIKLVDGNTKMILFANTLTNKAHQQDDYRYLTASIFSLQFAGDFPEIPVTGDPTVKPQPKPEAAAQVAVVRTVAQPKHAAWARPASASGELPKTGDANPAAPAAMAALAGGLIAAGALTRRRDHEE